MCDNNDIFYNIGNNKLYIAPDVYVYVCVE